MHLNEALIELSLVFLLLLQPNVAHIRPYKLHLGVVGLHEVAQNGLRLALLDAEGRVLLLEPVGQESAQDDDESVGGLLLFRSRIGLLRHAPS